MTIITQTEDLINYDAIKKICLVVGTIDDEQDNSQTQVYAVLAFDINSDIADEEDGDNSIQLGIYRSEIECRNVINEFISCLQAKESVFIMPQPTNFES